MNPPQITTRQEKKAYRQIVEAILGMITDGSLEYGSKLYKEQELGQLLGVSRPTLREALRALEILGIVTVRPRNGIITIIRITMRATSHCPISFPSKRRVLMSFMAFERRFK